MTGVGGGGSEVCVYAIGAHTIYIYIYIEGAARGVVRGCVCVGCLNATNVYAECLLECIRVVVHRTCRLDLRVRKIFAPLSIPTRSLGIV